ncbi:5-carboxymethyl-2-hydroxymuconate Delta-isomerase [Salinibius halmophilus]|uniref:5-carboxymethyl-2-hydroxymuconate Delta-isomerase n=1 Tax=Salinibius halmophilus TaxID=1853216 RepID=UPI000E66B4A9|nr:hypothetical protein [Salinibius halmophilus]
MPHLVFEYTANLQPEPEWQLMLQECHQFLATTGEWDLADIKSRVYKTEIFLQGDKPEKAHITLTLQMLDGRSDELKAKVAKALGKIIERYVDTACVHTMTNITVQCVDIHRASYYKRA